MGGGDGGTCSFRKEMRVLESLEEMFNYHKSSK